MTGLTHDQRRCIAHTVLCQGYRSIFEEGVKPEFWPNPTIPVPDPDKLSVVLERWHQQMLHLADMAVA